MFLSVLYRRWHPRQVSDIRAEVATTEDKETKADSLSQLILKYGTQGWVDEMIDQAGPMLLHNTEQAAAVLERLQKFVGLLKMNHLMFPSLYEWRDPFQTSVTLGMLMCFWTLITLTPTWLLVQMSFAAVGAIFFVLEPIGSRHPRYRLLCSPFTLLLWKVPTHGKFFVLLISYG